MALKVINIENNMKGIFSTHSFKIGQLIYTFNPQYIEYSTKTSIQHNNKHFEDDIGRYLNHHCNPNVSIVSDERGIHLLAIDVIKKNDEITFDYNLTEYKISYPFKCNCHNKLIKGKYYKTPSVVNDSAVVT